MNLAKRILIVMGWVLLAVLLLGYALITLGANSQHTTQFLHRDALERMLIRDEIGSATVNHMLHVSHDGQAALVVGVGHDVLPEDALKLGDSITLSRAAEFFEKDVDDAISHARHVVDDFDSHPANTQIVLCALAFQLGEGGLRSFTHMLSAIKSRDYDSAAKHLLDSKLAREQTHQRAVREANLIKTP